MSKNDILIKVNQLYKIFGDNSNEALDLVKDSMFHIHLNQHD